MEIDVFLHPGFNYGSFPMSVSLLPACTISFLSSKKFEGMAICDLSQGTG